MTNDNFLVLGLLCCCRSSFCNHESYLYKVSPPFFLFIIFFCFFFGLCLLVLSFAFYFWWMGSHLWFLYTRFFVSASVEEPSLATPAFIISFTFKEQTHHLSIYLVIFWVVIISYAWGSVFKYQPWKSVVNILPTQGYKCCLLLLLLLLFNHKHIV